ncbi:MAG: 4Fe-4S binding protein [Candidatus Cloacimonetes bacterium]|nr:4Fe-4S binding protein [Candidatus Cloacimonadota bacterium]
MGRFHIRRFIQYSFLGISAALFILLTEGALPIAHEFCPYSSVCFGVWKIGSKFAPFLFPAAIIIGGLIAISSMFLGRWFCGYVCPFGTIQELIYSARGPKTRFRQLIAYKTHKYLNILKYIILLFTAVTSYLSVQYLYMKFCPVMAIAHIQRITFAGIGVLIIIVAGGFFVERFWCRYLCPYAALMNIFQKLADLLKIRRYKIYRNIKTSLNCFNCVNYCPMNIDIGYLEKISDFNCIKCMRCVRQCSKSDKEKSNCIYRD